MAIQVKRGGVWTTPTSGSISIKSDGVWKSVNSLSLKNPSAAWVNSGYVAYPSAPTSFRATSTGNGDDRNVTFSWNAGAGGAPVSYYRLVIYYSTNGSTNTVGEYASLNTAGLSYTHQFPPQSEGTTWYARIFAVGTAGGVMGSNSVGGQRLRINVGAAHYYTDNYVWSNENYLRIPEYAGQSSGQRGPDAFDDNNDTYAQGQWWSFNTPDDNGYAEGLSFAFYGYHNNVPTRLLLIAIGSRTPDDAARPAQLWWDYLNYPYWSGLGYSEGTDTFLGLQFVNGNYDLAAGAGQYFRIHYNSLGYNPGPEYKWWYQWRTSQIIMFYKILVNSPIYTAPTNTVVSNA